MRMVGILLKREFKEKFTGLKEKKKDISGLIFNTLLVLAVLAVLSIVVIYLADTYTQVKIGYLSNKMQRFYEILTIYLAIVLIMLILVGVGKLNKKLIDVGNLTLLSLPISALEIFFSKMLIVFIDLASTCFIAVLPISIIYIVKGYLAWWSLFFVLLASILLPIVALGIASIFAIPYHFVKRWLNSHALIQLIIYVVLMAVAFTFYSFFLKVIKDLMESGKISFIFNESNVKAIGTFCSIVYPANIVAKLMIGEKIFINILLLLAGTVVGGVICFFINKFAFSLVRRNKIGLKQEVKIVRKAKRQKKVGYALINKEFINVLRTPSYAFSYFAIVLTLPIMIVVTSSLLISMLENLTMLDYSFEIVLCTVCMYSILLNTFCSNNMSRDGKFFNLMKTYPVTAKKVVFSKVLFCSITSVLSIVLSGIVILVTNQLVWWKVLEVVAIGIILNIAIVCLATRKDLNTMKNLETEENNASTNFIIFGGLSFSIVVTAISLVLSILLYTIYNVAFANLIIFLTLLLISIVILVVSILYLLKNLDKKYKEVTL